MDSSRTFGNAYYRNLEERKGVFDSDQALYTDPRSQPLVEELASKAVMVRFSKELSHAQ
ncbi:hem peroxidase superfamily [Arabidopsis thaliana x Arabidopsis arenosa]|uniref:peroxidase n=2 Tax=Arabidopsis TaxID=3701 RepID=A0A8T1YF59_ARASU|nr:hem peroxidase superfamily [Arabidopsis thaliana x Arabidopsis arenosa]KAG7544712.1 hem peroxidase superfamily [Arabidopsis suecica]